MENKEQVYSRDNEKYTDYANLMDDLKETYDIGEIVEVWEADEKGFVHSQFIDVDDLIYRMQVNAMDECGEIAEEYLNDLTVAKKIDLHRYLYEWFNKNAKLDFYGVENQKKIIVIVD